MHPLAVAVRRPCAFRVIPALLALILLTSTGCQSVRRLYLPPDTERTSARPGGEASEPTAPMLFNGFNLEGWRQVSRRGGEFYATNGLIVCPAGTMGNLFTTAEYENFIFQFEFNLSSAANSGVALRAPLPPDPTFPGLEIQLLDHERLVHGKLRPDQRQGSLYDLAAAKRGALKKSGQWNQQEITVNGRAIKVVLNGVVILQTNLNQLIDRASLAKHPGLVRNRGHVGFMGNGDAVQFRNIRIRELAADRADNQPPAGFQSLLNGTNLTHWRGFIGDIQRRRTMGPADLALAQQQADARLDQRWQVRDGAITYIGDAYDNLVSAEEYEDFELWVDWKLEPPGGDSGLYLRGTPQVQIWSQPEGSGGLWNNKTNPARPLVVADRAPGKWNEFKVLMFGDRVTVFLNGQLVTHDVILENFWDRTMPVYARGPIELQAHQDRVWFKNIYIRPIPRR